MLYIPPRRRQTEVPSSAREKPNNVPLHLQKPEQEADRGLVRQQPYTERPRTRVATACDRCRIRKIKVKTT